MDENDGKLASWKCENRVNGKGECFTRCVSKLLQSNGKPNFFSLFSAKNGFFFGSIEFEGFFGGSGVF